MNEKNLKVIQKVLNKNRVGADSIECSMMHQHLFNEHVDWHEYSNYLDTLYRTGFLKISASGGFTQYARI